MVDGRPAGAEPPAGDLVEYTLRCQPEVVEAVYEAFSRACTHGAVIEELDPRGQPTLQVKGYLLADDDPGARKLQEAVWHLSQIQALADLVSRRIRSQDWSTAWQEAYPEPQRIGRRVLIRFPWQRCDPGPGEVLIELEPGMAFGTGLHPSTRGCLLLLEEHLRPGMRLLDVGTGSGILAIAALRLGAERVEALDVDEEAIRVARANARANGLGQRLTVRPGTLSGRGWPAYDLVVANILAAVIVELAPAVGRILHPGGRWIAGGILVEQLGWVEPALAGHGFGIEARRQLDDWVSLLLAASG